MAKIIAEGLQQGWWVGMHVTCPSCQTVFEVEDTDTVWEKAKTEPLTGAIASTVAFIDCPGCQRPAQIPPPSIVLEGAPGDA